MSLESRIPSVWRVRMKAGLKRDHAGARLFAIKHGFVGAGWALFEPPQPAPLEDGCDDLALYLSYAKNRVSPKLYKNLERDVRVLSSDMMKGDHCWLYVTHTGEYWCGRVIDEKMQYRHGGEFDKFDLHLVRRCSWSRAGAADAVPGVIRRAFAGPFGTIGLIKTDARVAIEAAEIIAGSRKPTGNGDFFALATPEDLEDVVALYLQEQGWRLLPSTAKVSMASYEFVLVHSKTGTRAGVQVKSGNVHHLDQKVAADFDSFFVLLANPGATLVGDIDKITPIDRAKIAAFAKQNWAMLPQRLKKRWPLT